MENLRQESISRLLRAANRLQKDPAQYSTAPAKAPKVRIAVLGSHSIQHFVKVFNLFLDRAGIKAEIYEGEYGGINMDVLDENSPLYQFKPEFVLIFMRYNDIQLRSEKDLETEKAYLKSIWSHLDKIPGVTILNTNFAVPMERPFGTLEADYGYSTLTLFRELNLSMTKDHPKNVRIIDMEYLSALYGKENWFDEGNYYLTKQGFGLDYLGPVADEVTKMILPSVGVVRKCLVLDLDNTLWGGVVGDDGPMGIEVDPHNPLGEAYRAFQSYVLSLKQRGVILAVNSKNDLDVAKEPFEKNPDMVLKLSDIACFVANWQDKASNMAYIAKKLNIGMDSLVFFDDNPAEREIIRKFCPEVCVIDVPNEAENYVRALNEASPFEWAQITKEDMARSDSYVENAKREEMEASFVDYTEYLKALEMKGVTGLVGEDEVERFSQLTNKSNQFNLRTQRYADSQIREMLEDDKKRCIYVSLTDKFTQYGIISCIILSAPNEDNGCEADECFVENWCMSCRVLKRSVELYAFRAVIEEARKMGAKRLVGEYIRSKKNSMVENLLPSFGFTVVEKTEDRVRYTYDLAKDPEGEVWIQS
ncbi:HAD-superfamily phosphatase, subfamily IIIC/FkbH-like domain-containing protein [Lachnospiraceae bacterium]|nr:HAD-superfamily phosphatase, subfamily IIIC/FkbH-like domain-containing protein [Lachnospiraceae bacterium]